MKFPPGNMKSFRFVNLSPSRGHTFTAHLLGMFSQKPLQILRKTKARYLRNGLYHGAFSPAPLYYHELFNNLKQDMIKGGE